jgi:hypothetical protein
MSVKPTKTALFLVVPAQRQLRQATLRGLYHLPGGQTMETLGYRVLLGKTFEIHTPEGKLPDFLFTDYLAATKVAQKLEEAFPTLEALRTLLSRPGAAKAALDALTQHPTEAAGSHEISALSNTLEVLGWSQSKLARKLGVDPNTVSRWITGKSPVPLWLMEYLGALRAVKELALKLDL